MTDKVKHKYRDNGKLFSEITLREGKLHGIIKRWYENGQLQYEHQYHEGQIHGIAKGWYKDGKLWYTSYFLYGSKVNKRKYNDNKNNT